MSSVPKWQINLISLSLSLSFTSLLKTYEIYPHGDDDAMLNTFIRGLCIYNAQQSNENVTTSHLIGNH